MAALRWSEDAYLFVLGTLAFSCALFGLAARRGRWRGWTTPHILGMSSSYIVLLTAFYVDNGPRLPLWKELPPIAFCVGPTVIGVPILMRALMRHAHVRRDLRELVRPRRGGPVAVTTEPQ